MSFRRYLLEAGTLILAAVLCAMIANLLASRERKVALVGNYPNARVVPSSASTPSLTPTVEASTVTNPPRPVETQTTDPAEAPDTTPKEPAKASENPQPTAKTPDSGAEKPPAALAKTASATPPSAAPEPSLAQRFPPHPDAPYVEIHGDDVTWLHDRGALFLDARRTSIYEEGHIPGARPFSVWESDVDDKVAALLDEGLDQSRPIVVYCSGGDCEDSHMLAQKLWGVFFNNVLVYKDGFPDWQKRGRPVVTGGGS